MKTGEIYWVNLDPTIRDDIKKRRPVVVLNGGHQKHLKLAISAPITAWKACWEENPFFVSLDPDPINGLQKKSVVDCFQIRAISQERFGEKIGRISSDQIDLLKKAIALILDIDQHHCE